jgi:pimeloyl-ACP methyl ester carboxylesterase
MKPSRSLRVPVRGLDYHVRAWGDPAARKVFLLHGWMDVSASFQFLVDALPDDWHVLAPDWRGFGLSANPQDGYWFADYVADLDALARALSPDAPIDVAGHSLGANVAMFYAGARPQRVARVAALDGFGVPSEAPERAPAKFRKWLDAVADLPAFAPYASMAAVADRLQKNNPRLSRDRAEWLAPHWAEALPDGTARLREIKAPVLWMRAAESDIGRWLAGGGDAAAEVARRFTHVPNGRLVTVEGAGHMLHHDQPEAVAHHLAGFFAGHLP